MDYKLVISHGTRPSFVQSVRHLHLASTFLCPRNLRNAHDWYHSGLRTHRRPVTVNVQSSIYSGDVRNTIKGTANPFEIFLASSDLSQFVTISANFNPTYNGFWTNAQNVGALWQLGEQFSPPIRPTLGGFYEVIISMDASGSATVTILDVFAGTQLGSLSSLQAGGTGPFYLVLGQRIGLAKSVKQVADWSYVALTQ